MYEAWFPGSLLGKLPYAKPRPRSPLPQAVQNKPRCIWAFQLPLEPQKNPTLLWNLGWQQSGLRIPKRWDGERWGGWEGEKQQQRPKG